MIIISHDRHKSLNEVRPIWRIWTTNSPSPSIRVTTTTTLASAQSRERALKDNAKAKEKRMQEFVARFANKSKARQATSCLKQAHKSNRKCIEVKLHRQNPYIRLEADEKAKLQPSAGRLKNWPKRFETQLFKKPELHPEAGQRLAIIGLGTAQVNLPAETWQAKSTLNIQTACCRTKGTHQITES